jgi:hypothetical protein
MNPDTIRRDAMAQAQRIARERLDDRADIPRMAAALMHREMLRELEPYHRMKARAMVTILTPGYAVRADGGLEPLQPDIPAEMPPGLNALDRHIAGIEDSYREAIAATLGPFTPAELVLMNEAGRLAKIVTIA